MFKKLFADHRDRVATEVFKRSETASKRPVGLAQGVWLDHYPAMSMDHALAQHG